MSCRKPASGCLFGLALGDALAAPTEFMRVSEIVRVYGKDGPDAPSDRVTDDTQMMLAVGESLTRADKPLTVATLEAELRQAFVDWSISPDNDRAPGNTCMNACVRLRQGVPWHDATVVSSKGCGANMRVAPVGLLREEDGVDGRTRAAVAQFQAALTHGHPTALAASDLTAYAVSDLRRTGSPEAVVDRLRAYWRAQREVYHEQWLGPLWTKARAATPRAFISQGWDQCLGLLDRLEAAFEAGDTESDPCLATGEGWIAEEALATGLLCFLLHLDDPVRALRRAAVTSGDSDSIACLTGAFAGAYYGIDAWPPEWVRRVEYHQRIAAVARAWD